MRLAPLWAYCLAFPQSQFVRYEPVAQSPRWTSLRMTDVSDGGGRSSLPFDTRKTPKPTSSNVKYAQSSPWQGFQRNLFEAGLSFFSEPGEAQQSVSSSSGVPEDVTGRSKSSGLPSERLVALASALAKAEEAISCAVIAAEAAERADSAASNAEAAAMVVAGAARKAAEFATVAQASAGSTRKLTNGRSQQLSPANYNRNVRPIQKVGGDGGGIERESAYLDEGFSKVCLSPLRAGPLSRRKPSPTEIPLDNNSFAVPLRFLWDEMGQRMILGDNEDDCMDREKRYMQFLVFPDRFF